MVEEEVMAMADMMRERRERRRRGELEESGRCCESRQQPAVKRTREKRVHCLGRQRQRAAPAPPYTDLLTWRSYK
jgi:hypothetical protein